MGDESAKRIQNKNLKEKSEIMEDKLDSEKRFNRKD